MQLAKGNLARTAAFRLPPGEDVLEGLKAACDAAGIADGVILSGIGSLDGARYFNPVPLAEKKAGYGYGEALELRGPIELVSMSGMICRGDKGETTFHVHCGFSDQYGHGHGGHLIAGNKVLLTVDVVVAELENIHMGRRYDDDLEVCIFHPEERRA